MESSRFQDIGHLATHRPEIKMPARQGEVNYPRISDYYGEKVFDFRKCKEIPEKVKKDLIEANRLRKPITKENASIVAKAVTQWAIKRGATHFCHWFQPLTGTTAQKQDSFLSFTDDGQAIESLSAFQLTQSEPDASSFPSGGTRSTFEARGYTAWDISSPMFLKDGVNGSYLCIPSAFVSYHGQSLDVKTPCLRSIARLGEAATRFLHITGQEAKEVKVTCGPEQEYFLIDQAFYYARPDLVMTGRALIGQMSPKHQQLEDHYFGTIPDRALSFMQELDYELYRLGIPSKTRHNEVAPCQFEVAPIFCEANLASDQN
ncbi:MAG: glutamine synthetase III, partial [Pseudomonadota bacterium]